MNIGLACDHGGFPLKSAIAAFLVRTGYAPLDLGCFAEETVDYPDVADKLCIELEQGAIERGILICGTGIGMCMAANRHRHIRAALCHEAYTARMSREHNDANVLCLGARVLGPALAVNIVQVWMDTRFLGGRHGRRIALIG